MSNKPALPKGMRDFDPATLAKRNYVIHSLKNILSGLVLMNYKRLV